MTSLAAPLPRTANNGGGAVAALRRRHPRLLGECQTVGPDGWLRGLDTRFIWHSPGMRRPSELGRKAWATAHWMPKRCRGKTRAIVVAPEFTMEGTALVGYWHSGPHSNPFPQRLPGATLAPIASVPQAAAVGAIFLVMA